MTARSKLRQAAIRPRGKSTATLVLMSEVLRVLAGFDGSMSTRQVYYQLVSSGALENNGPGYDRAQRLLVQMRREGHVPYDRIVDRTRAKHQREGWQGAQDVLDAVAEQYRRNRWTDQNTIVMVACEKQALEGIFAEVCDEYGASLWTVRGFSSLGFHYEWATEIKRLEADGHTVIVAYFGDHDPSGLCLERKSREGLAEHGVEVAWQRHGLLLEDFERFDLVNVPVKRSDSRSRDYLAEFGDRAAELDALPPAELRRRIRDAIEIHLDVDAWNRLGAVEDVERESIATVARAWDVALAAATEAA